jgi:hypothetical protein
MANIGVRKMMFCILIKEEKFTNVVGPFLSAQDAARFVTDKFTAPLRAACSIIPMISLSTFKGNGGEVIATPKVTVNGRHTGYTRKAEFLHNIARRDNDTVIRIDDPKHLDFWMEIILENQQIV